MGIFKGKFVRFLTEKEFINFLILHSPLKLTNFHVMLNKLYIFNNLITCGTFANAIFKA